VVSDQNPFTLFKDLEGTKGNAPARGGEVAPDDIWIRSGETPFKPGPVVGELQKAGIPAAIDRGKVVIRQDKLLVKRGDRIPRDVASVLTRLEIYPLIVGLDLRGAFEEGTLFRRDTLAVDDARVRADLAIATRAAFNLALYAWIPTPTTARPLMTRAHLQALALATRAGYVSMATAPVLLGSAQARALRLAALVGSKEPKALDEAILRQLEGVARPPSPEAARGEKKEEKKEEEKVTEEEAAAGLGSLFG
jgi:large subunit ribosomal protein L10